jgi:mannan endo-1,4-beta-mannosidase
MRKAFSWVLIIMMLAAIFSSLTIQAATTITVLYKCNETNANTNTIRPWFQVSNTGNTAIALSSVKIRYWYTADTSPSQTFFCDWAQLGSANITGSFVKMATPAGTADSYVEVGFSSGAGSLAPGASTGEIQTRFNKSDYSNYNQSNDFSFNPSLIAYAQNTRVTGYVDGILVFGSEPGGAGPTPTSVTLTPTPALTPTARVRTPTPVRTATPGRTPTPRITVSPAGTPPLSPTPALTPTPFTVTPTPTQGASDFVTRNGSKLYIGSKQFRFVSVNIPNYFILENRAGTTGSKWHRVTEFEQRDACQAVKRLGGQLFRAYTFSVQGGVNVENNLAHIYKSGSQIVYNEDLFKDVDRGLAIAREEGLKVYIPLVDNWNWFGGYAEWAVISGGSNFWNDTVCKTAFKNFVTWLVNRTNTVTGVKYKDDPTIMAWELGNEIDKANAAWISEVAAHLKSVDPNHLIIDGGHKTIPSVSLSDKNIDIVTTHYTDGELQNFITMANNANKPYIYGEYSPDSTSKVRDIVNRIIAAPGAAGCLVWSLRFRTDLGGFYYHGDFGFDSLQYPGFNTTAPSDEITTFTALKNGAYQIQGLTVPPEPVPPAPILLPIISTSVINWKGSAGATSYILQRSTSTSGPWTVVATNVSDAVPMNYDGQIVAKLPLYSDNPGNGTFYYRVIAVNTTGQSAPSNVASVTQ